MPPLLIFTTIVATAFLLMILWDVYKRQKGRPLFPSDEEKYAQEIKAGKVVIVPSKFEQSKDGQSYLGKLFIRLSYPLTWIGLFLVGMWLAVWSSDYVDTLAVDCQQIYGLNPLLLEDIINICILPVFGIMILISHLYHYKKLQKHQGHFYPATDSKPLLYPKICKKIDNVTITKQKKTVIATVGIVIIFVVITPFRFAGSLSDLPNLNEVYQQKCLAKEYPFSRLHK